jgi:hypothetical protein
MRVGLAAQEDVPIPEGARAIWQAIAALEDDPRRPPKLVELRSDREMKGAVHRPGSAPL